MPIRDLNRALDWNLPDEEAVTIAGLVIHETGTIPEERQAFTFFQKRFTVLKRERNRIAKLRIRSASVVVPPKKGALAALAIGAAAQSDDYEMDEEEGLDEEVAALAVEEARREAGEAPEHDAPAERSAEKDTFIESDDPEAEPRR